MNAVILWGYTYAKGDPIRKNLHTYIRDLHREMMYITKIEPMDTFKGFPTEGVW